MSKPPIRKNANETQETAKAPFLVVQRIREGILAEAFKPGDHLGEIELADKFEVSRSPVREALVSLEKEGTLIVSPYKGAMVNPLSVAEVMDIAELRLALISLALKPAHRHFSPADFDHAYDLAKRITRTKSIREAFECNRRFWDIIFRKAERPILWETFWNLDDRMTRYYSPLLELYPTPESRPRHHEALIENYRKGKIAEAFQAFKKIYLKMADQLIDHLNSREAD
jgi:DNA-binding GntR family transcriptional regulator